MVANSPDCLPRQGILILREDPQTELFPKIYRPIDWKIRRVLWRVHRAWLILLASFLTLFIAFAIRFGYSVLLPQILLDINLSRTESALIFTAYMGGYTILSPLSGVLSDRWGGRIVVSSFCIVMGLGAILMGTTTSLLTGIAYFFIVGCGGSASWVGSASLVQRWFAPRWRGKTLGIMEVGVGLGYGSTGILLPMITLAEGWRAGWYFLGLTSILVGLINIVLLRNDPQDVGLRQWGSHTDSKEYGKPKGQDDVYFLRRSTFWLILLSYLSSGFSTFIIFTFIVVFANAELQLPYTFSSILVSLMAAGGIVGAISLTAVSDRLGRRALLIVCNMAACISIALMSIASPILLLLAISAVAYGFFREASFPIYATCASDYFSTRVAGKVLGLWTLGHGISAFFSPLAGGYLADISNTFYWSFMLSALASGLAAALILPIHEYRPRR